jgi:large subunit ribosomal protein L29
MKPSEIRELGAGDIETRITELEEERFRLRFRSGTETLENPMRLRVLRKDIARLKTALREKADSGKPGAAASATTKSGKRS